ncbi:unnamed protein product, partial [Polarella glacialis]
ELLACISRSHFELVLESPTGPLLLRKLSANPLLLDDHVLAQGAVVAVGEGSQLVFGGDVDPRFLVLMLRCRSKAQVSSEGQHPAVVAAAGLPSALSPQSPLSQNAQSATVKPATHMVQLTAVAAVLECVVAQGADLGSFSSEARAIALPMDEPIEVGRQHQLGFFDRLLQADQSFWLSFISRTHLRVTLSQSQSQPLSLKVENLSANPIMVGGRPLGKGQSDSISEGGKLVFVAKGRDEKETAFLEFLLRRARGQTRSA